MMLRRLFTAARPTTTMNAAKVATASFASSASIIEDEKKYSALNYAPLPVVYSKAKGTKVWDPEGKEYFDFLSAYSAVNQGHCHPKIVNAAIDQLQSYTLSSRAFYNDQFPPFAKYVTEYFGFDRVLPMNTGAEAVETALKLARRWGYEKKGIPQNEGIIVACCGNFHGRTAGPISLTCDPSSYGGFGPYVPGVEKVKYNDLEQVKSLFERKGGKIAGIILEPIQGEQGVVVPDDDWVRGVRKLCDEHNVLFIGDEVQSGLCRSGKLLALDYPEVRPDILILGKAVSGGLYPISLVLADTPVMEVIRPGEHGSTFGGNPVASAIGMAALEVLKEEKLAEKAFAAGEKFRDSFNALDLGIVDLVRGRGLLNAVVIRRDVTVKAIEICYAMAEKGLLAKPTHDDIIRFAPPLTIADDEMDQCLDIIHSTLKEFDAKAKKCDPTPRDICATCKQEL